MTTIEKVDTVVIGAGHAGLAVSRLLTDAGRDHVVLDRGRIGERWRTERWDSLHLLTPSWMTRLPGLGYDGRRPGRLPLPAPEFVRTCSGTPHPSMRPSSDEPTVLSVSPEARRLRRRHRPRSTWRARHVVVATGPHGTAARPAGVGHAAPTWRS